jgi:hypothetical protein
LRQQISDDATRIIELQSRLTDVTERFNATNADTETTSGPYSLTLVTDAPFSIISYDMICDG